MTFFEMTPSVLSALEPKVAQDYIRDGKAVLRKSFEIDVAPSKDLVARAFEGGPVNFVSIDIEELDAEILSLADFTKFRPTLICIEANDETSSKVICEVLERADYKVVREVDCNIFAAPR